MRCFSSYVATFPRHIVLDNTFPAGWREYGAHTGDSYARTQWGIRGKRPKNNKHCKLRRVATHPNFCENAALKNKHCKPAPPILFLML